MGFDQESTDWICKWIVNDGDYYDAALCAAEHKDYEALEMYLRAALYNAPKGSGAWHTAQELSANDLDRIDWKDIAEALTSK